MRVRVLGPLEVSNGNYVVDIGHSKQCAVLAILGVEAGKAVTVDSLVYRLWGDEAPRRARRTLQSYIARLRSVLDGEGIAISRRREGYSLAIDPEAVDVFAFRNLVEAARRAESAHDATELRRQALALWRGEPFQGLDLRWLHQVAAGLSAERRALEIDDVEARLSDGELDGLVLTLEERAAQWPLDERVAGQLVRALHGSGRTAEALGFYQRFRERTVAELGQEPGARLREVHRDVLRNDSYAAAKATVDVSRLDSDDVVKPDLVPRQLPKSPRAFVGRTDQLAWLDAAREEAADQRPRVVSGPGGIGKSWLVLHWAHSAASDFPDGQLYVDLNGFDPHSRPKDPGTVLRQFLEALGVATEHIPDDLGSRAALFRTRLADKRVLMLLDNARDSSQVADLLPGTGDAVVVVTSRVRLETLVASHDAKILNLATLTFPEAQFAMEKYCGQPRFRAEPEAAVELVAHCAGLPLALGVLGGRIAVDPQLRLSDLLDELRDASSRLDAMESGELSMGVRTVLDSSCDALSDTAARLFAMLSLAPGRDISTDAMANLSGVTRSQARKTLRELEGAHLVTRQRAGRFSMHDLTRLFATERGAALSETERQAALGGYAAYFVHAGARAHHTLNPDAYPLPLAAPGSGTVLPDIEGSWAAQSWFEEEWSNLYETQRAVAESGSDAVWQLAWIAYYFLKSRGFHTAATRMWRLAIESVHQWPDSVVAAYCHAGLAASCARTGDYELGEWAIRESHRLASAGEDTQLREFVWDASARLAYSSGDYEVAADYFQKSADLAGRAGREVREAGLLNDVAWCLTSVRLYDDARRLGENALEIYRRHDQLSEASFVMDTLGRIAHRLGEFDVAVDWFERAAASVREQRQPGLHSRFLYHIEADIKAHLGDAQRESGESAAALRSWRQWYRIYRDISGDEEAQTVLNQIVRHLERGGVTELTDVDGIS